MIEEKLFGCWDRMAVDDYAALASRLSIRLRSTSKSMGLVSSASAPPTLRAALFRSTMKRV